MRGCLKEGVLRLRKGDNSVLFCPLFLFSCFASHHCCFVVFVVVVVVFDDDFDVVVAVLIIIIAIVVVVVFVFVGFRRNVQVE